MRPEPVKHPRRIGKHVSGAIDLLTELGASDIRVFKTRHVAIVFAVGRHELTVRTASTPQDDGDALEHIRQAIQREVARVLAGARV